MKLLIIDNYDSFTYNLVHIVRDAGVAFDIYRNDKISVEAAGAYDAFLLSPGPGVPEDAGILKSLIAAYRKTHPILGVCLGHQAIGEVMGARLHNLETVFHGVATEMTHSGEDALFSGIPETFSAGRYHSWNIAPEDFPEELEIIARDGAGQIMAVRHRTENIRGVQFHPESVLTPQGEHIVRNFLEKCAGFPLSSPQKVLA